jgi:hypothetical protein
MSAKNISFMHALLDSKVNAFTHVSILSLMSNIYSTTLRSGVSTSWTVRAATQGFS